MSTLSCHIKLIQMLIRSAKVDKSHSKVSPKSNVQLAMAVQQGCTHWLQSLQWAEMLSNVNQHVHTATIWVQTKFKIVSTINVLDQGVYDIKYYIKPPVAILLPSPVWPVAANQRRVGFHDYVLPIRFRSH